jgi:tetratricopeptide (TPR) repeat protein
MKHLNYAFALGNRAWLVAACLAAVLSVACGAGSRKDAYLHKGHTLLDAGNFNKARIEFRNALQIAPNDGEIRFENGLVAEKLGDLRQAAQFYQGAIDVKPDDIRARVALGRIYLMGSAPDLALATIEPAILKHPDDPGLLTVRAAARVQLKNPVAALEDAERAVKLAPTYEDAVSVLADIYQGNERTDAALALLERAVKQMPNAVNLRLQLARLYVDRGQASQAEMLLVDLIHFKPADKTNRLQLAILYSRENRTDEAERVLRDGIKALPAERDLKIALVDLLASRRSRDLAEKQLLDFSAQDPKDYELRFALARFHEQGKEPARAESVYKQVIAASGFDGPGITARDHLALLRLEQNDIAGAQRLIAEVLAKSPRDDDALFLRGSLAVAHKDPKTAIADLRAVLGNRPQSTRVMRLLGRAYLANGDAALDQEMMQRAVVADPSDASARLDLAQLLIANGKPEQARPIIDELIQQQPDNTAARELQFKIAAAGEDVASAKAAAVAMVAINPKLAIGYYYQGVAAEMEHHASEAMQFYRYAIEREPKSWLAYRSLALAQAHEQDDGVAEATLESAIEKVDTPEPLEAALGGLYERGGKPDAAVQVYENGLRHSPNSELIANNLAMLLANTRVDSAGLERARQLTVRLCGSNSPSFLDTCGWVLYKRGEAPAAVTVLRRASSRGPESPEIWFHLGMAQIGAGQLETARVSLAHALSSKDRFVGIEEAQQTFDKLAKQVPTEVLPKS